MWNRLQYHALCCNSFALINRRAFQSKNQGVIGCTLETRNTSYVPTHPVIPQVRCSNRPKITSPRLECSLRFTVDHSERVAAAECSNLTTEVRSFRDRARTATLTQGFSVHLLKEFLLPAAATRPGVRTL